MENEIAKLHDRTLAKSAFISSRFVFREFERMA